MSVIDIYQTRKKTIVKSIIVLIVLIDDWFRSKRLDVNL